MTRVLHSFFTLLLCIGLDWLWMRVVGNQLLNYQADKWFQPTDLVFYCLFTSGLLMLSVYPALYVRDRNIALYNAACFGLAAHGLYEFVSSLWYNMYYPVTLAVADTLWGTFAGIVAGFFSFEMGHWLRMSGSAEKDMTMDEGMFLE